MKRLALLVALLACTGSQGPVALAYCQDSGSTNEGAAQSAAPASAPKPAAGSATVAEKKAEIVVYRETARKGRWIKPPVFCDNIEVGYLDNGRYIILLVAPGKHTITSDKTGSSVAVDAKEEQPSYVSLHVVWGWKHGLGVVEQQPAETARASAASLVPIQPDAIVEPNLVCLDRTHEIKLCSLQE
jgi:hypothetical protein